MDENEAALGAKDDTHGLIGAFVFIDGRRGGGAQPREVLVMIRLVSAALAAAMALAVPAIADDEGDYGPRRWGGEDRQIKYRDGDCKIEREWKKGGEYKHKVECDKDGGGWRRQWGGDDREFKYRDGDCKVEREWKKDGEYKETVECDGPSYRRGRRLSSVTIDQDPGWVNPDGSLPAPQAERR